MIMLTKIIKDFGKGKTRMFEIGEGLCRQISHFYHLNDMERKGKSSCLNIFEESSFKLDVDIK